MKYRYLLVDISEQFPSESKPQPSAVLLEFVQFLKEHGFVSLEILVSDVLQNFIGVSANQIACTSDSGLKTPSFYAIANRRPSAFITSLQYESALVFVDLEEGRARSRISGKKTDHTMSFWLEFDLFANDQNFIQQLEERLVDSAMKCFGLTKAKTDLIERAPGSNTPAEALRKKLARSERISDELFQRLKEKEDRGILLELKTRGFILDRNLTELDIQGIATDRVKRTLDYFSGDEIRLVERKYAIVCREKNEIIFLMRTKQDIENARALECPRCSRPLGSELVVTHYGVTDNLRILLDKSRWMPALVREYLIHAGVPEEAIEVEVKYGEDEIDLLVFHKGKIFVIETKDRPISLNDAYKLSAKTARIEAVISKFSQKELDNDLDYQRGLITQDDLEKKRKGPKDVIPVIISTGAVAKDARELLNETKESAKCLEMCDGKLEEFLNGLVSAIDESELQERFNELVSWQAIDSISQLTGAQVEHAFRKWLENANSRAG